MKKNPIVIYYSSPLTLINVFLNLQGQTDRTYHEANIMDCPGVRNGMANLYAVCSFQDESYRFNTITQENKLTYKVTDIEDNVLEHIEIRAPYFDKSFFFSLGYEALFFAEEPVEMKATSPWFHVSSFQQYGTTIGGQFDIGQWCRPLEIDILCWKTSGEIHFKKNEPLYYVQFLTDRPILFKEFVYTPIIQGFVRNLVFDPKRVENKRFGSLTKRYKAFTRSDYREGLLREIKANLVLNNSSSIKE